LIKRIFSLAVLLVATVAFAQEDRGRINGLVTDPSGAVIPQATVTLRSEGTGVVISKQSDGAGAFSFELLNPGLYTVEIQASGFKQFNEQHIRVEVADRVGVKAKMTPGGGGEIVTVTESGGAHLKTEDAILGFTVESRSANELPLLYSNPFELQLLAPGVSSTSLSLGNHTYEGGTESAVINGGSQSGRTEFTLDGAPDTRNGGAVTTAYVPSRDFIGEFKLITSPYDASLAHTSGASLDTSLKAGTRQFHGGVQVFSQIPSVNAPQFSQGATTPPAAKYNRESAEVDGPILPRKLFFFGGYEKQYNKTAASTTTQTVPTVAEKNGDFSALLAAGSVTTSTYTCPTNNVKLTTAPYNTYQIYNPYSTRVDPNCPALYVRDPVPGNIISNVRPIDPVAKKIISYYPDPTGSGSQAANGANNFVSNAANVDYAWDVSSRIDYNLSETQKFFGHYIISDRRQPGKNLFFPGASGRTSILRNKGGALDYVNTLTNTLVLDVRYSLTRFTTSSISDALTNATDLGINANATAGVPAVGLGFPYFTPSGFAELGNADPSFEFDTIHDAQVNVTKVVGRHSLKFGVDWRLYQANQSDLTNSKLFIASSGTYTKGPSSSLSNSQLGQSLASLEFGISESTKETLNAQTSNNTKYWSSFIQDDWKATPKLTLNLGLRYEYGSPIKERNGKSISYFDTSVANPISTQAKANYAATSNPTEQALVPVSAFAVNGGVRYVAPGQDLWNAQTLNFSPRFGFSWNPFQKLVVRGGFGLFFQHYGEYVQYGNPLGFTQTTNTVATTDNGVTYQASLTNPFPNGLVQPSGNTNGLLQNVGQSISQFYQQNPKSPYNERFSFGFQYQLPGDIISEVNYVGSFGRHLTITRDFNAVPDSFLSTTGVRNTAISGKLTGTYPNPFLGIVVPGTTQNTTTISGSQLVKPFPEFTGLTGRDNSGMSNYHALQISTQKRFSHGYNMSVSYQWSRTLDAISFLNAGDAQPWYGVSNSDYPQVLSTAAIYELPFGHGKPFFGSAPHWADEIIRGFQVQGTYRIASGQPLTFNNAGAILRPGKTFADIAKVSNKSYTNWFNTAAFINNRTTADGGDADCTGPLSTTCYTNTVLVSNLRTYPLRFNNVRQDYQNLLNVGALKKFRVYKERVDMDIRAEAINALNHQVYTNPNTDPGSSSFGKLGGPGNAARILQFAVEAHF
jgi:hypothetical protein